MLLNYLESSYHLGPVTLHLYVWDFRFVRFAVKVRIQPPVKTQSRNSFTWPGV